MPTGGSPAALVVGYLQLSETWVPNRGRLVVTLVRT